MQVYIAGTGKLATELLERLTLPAGLTLAPWADRTDGSHNKSIVVHAGSGREIEAIADHCARTSSVLVELSTGSALEGTCPSFPVVLCPNTNLLMLKFMCMLARSGSLFAGCEKQLIESHQASKTSVPGTAVQMAQSLGIPAAEIVSVREPSQQAGELQIPPAQLARHAFHRITLQDGACTLTMETRVFGDAPYASGVRDIVDAVSRRALAARVYSINEFIENGWV